MKGRPGVTWEEMRADAKKRAKIKPELCKPFKVRSFRFFPCAWAASLGEGYRYYLLLRNRRGFLVPETDSPRFRTRLECEAFADGNRCLPLA